MDIATTISTGVTFIDFLTGIFNNNISCNINESRILAIFKKSFGKQNRDLPLGWEQKSLSEKWDIITQDEQLKEYVENELFNDNSLSSSYQTFRLEEIYKEQTINKLLELDEQKTKKASFNKIVPMSDFCIGDLIIAPNYTIKSIQNDRTNYESTKNESESVFIAKCNEIIRNQKVLLIMGPYGSGKTFISKYYLSKITDGIPLFIYAHNLGKNLRDIFRYTVLEKLTKKRGKVYIFLDSCENYFSTYPNNLETIQDLKNIDNLYFILNIRKPSDIAVKDLFDYIKIALPEVKEYIELRYFTEKQTERWLTNYETCIKYDNHKGPQITYEDIKNANKNLRTSCHIPLMLTMMIIGNKCISDYGKNGWYELFNSFVDNTISGAFEYEGKIYKLLQGKRDEYSDFVHKLAFKILSNSNNIIKIDIKDKDSYLLDENKDTYSISQKSIAVEVNDILKDIKQTNTIKYLNCYFFEYERSTKRWKFKDNNILFFLGAKQIYDILNEMVSENDTIVIKDKINNHRNDLLNIPLHPVMIDFILDKIDFENSGKEFVKRIKYLIDNNIIINFPKKTDFVLSYDKIKLDILLSIIFIRYNNSYDKRNGLGHYFKRISHYYSIVKIIDPELASVIRRYYRYITVKNVEFRRINLKGYNWNHSRLKDAKIIQCKLFDTLMEDMVFDNVAFDLCFAEKQRFSNIHGSLKFRQCYLKDTIFILNNATRIAFLNCAFEQVRIISEDRTIIPDIILDYCDIRQLTIECSRVKIKIEPEITRNSIVLKNTQLYAVDEKHYDLGQNSCIDSLFECSDNSKITILNNNPDNWSDKIKKTLSDSYPFNIIDE